MEKTIEIPEGYEARIEDNKVILERKESEDERIRKSIIRILQVGGYMPDEEKNKAFAYLERKKPVQDKEEREYVRTIKSLIADFLRGKDEIDREYYQKIYDWLDGRHIEQNPAEWSEEDKVMLNNIIWSVHMKSIIKPLYEMDDRSRYKKYEDFLKALPERFNLQPKQEWSEEDEQTFIKSVETLEYLGKFELADWLKEHKNQFLKPQNTWKPSKEQMECLQVAASQYRDSEVADTLWALVNDLKKL